MSTPETTSPAPAKAKRSGSGSSSDVQEIPLVLVKRPTGDTHWDVATGTTQTIVHAETGEPTQEYALCAKIDGQLVPLESYSSGRLETAAANLKASASSKKSST